MEQYFTKTPTVAHDYRECNYELQSHHFTFLTDAGVFSKGEIDTGTDILLRTIPNLYGNVLDMGCGYGLVGIVCKKIYPNIAVTCIDINERAVELTKQNAQKNGVELIVFQSDGLEDQTKQFNFAIINPPIRAGKDTVYKLFTQLKAALVNEGTMYVVIRTKQGAKSAVEFLKTLFYNVNTLEIKSGYRILECKEPR